PGAGSEITANSYNFNDGNWHQAVGVFDLVNNTNLLYIDGAFNIGGANASGNIAGSLRDIVLGADPQYLNSSPTRVFDGAIAHAAYFTNALSAAQIQTIYNAAAVRPFILTQPGSATVVAGI